MPQKGQKEKVNIIRDNMMAVVPLRNSPLLNLVFWHEFKIRLQLQMYGVDCISMHKALDLA